MKKLFIFTLVAASAFAGSAIAAENCKNPQSQLAMNTCAAKDYERDDARLNKTYKELVGKLEKDRRDKVKEVQIAWIKYRDLQCDFDSAGYEGGTMYSLVRSSCLSRMTKERTKDLKAMLEETAM